MRYVGVQYKNETGSDRREPEEQNVKDDKKYILTFACNRCFTVIPS